MIPELLRGGLRIAVLVLVASLAMLPLQPRDSAEFYVTLISAIIGGLFLVLIVVAFRWLRPQPPPSPPVRLPHRDKPPGT